jgi:group I intron endonuclease
MERLTHSSASGIYKIESKINGKIYVGCASRFGDRKGDHFKRLRDKNHGSYLLQRHCDKHGIEDLVFKIIEIVPRIQDELITEFRDRLLKREQYYIDTLHPEFNICQVVNSCLGVVRSEEFKQKHRGENNASKRPEVKQKQSEARKRYWDTHPHPFGEQNSFYNKKHTQETCNKIGSKNKGKLKGNQHAKGNKINLTPEQRQKQKDWWTPERRKEQGEKGKGRKGWNKGLKGYHIKSLGKKREPHSEERKKKQSTTVKERLKNPENMEKHRAAIKKGWETRKNNKNLINYRKPKKE